MLLHSATKFHPFEWASGVCRTVQVVQSLFPPFPLSYIHGEKTPPARRPHHDIAQSGPHHDIVDRRGSSSLKGGRFSPQFNRWSTVSTETRAVTLRPAWGVPDASIGGWPFAIAFFIGDSLDFEVARVTRVNRIARTR